MSLQVLLRQKKDAIVGGWLDLLLQDYPPETVRFLKGQTDPFANPVGGIFREAIAQLYEELIGEADPGRSAALLDRIVRVRAVQDLPPSRALAFVPGLKKVVRDVLGSGASPDAPAGEPGHTPAATGTPGPPAGAGTPGAPAGRPHVRPSADGNGPVRPEEWRELDERIDRLALLAFDVYLACREKVHEIRFTELKNRTHLLLQRAGLVVDGDGWRRAGEGEG